MELSLSSVAYDAIFMLAHSPKRQKRHQTGAGCFCVALRVYNWKDGHGVREINDQVWVALVELWLRWCWGRMWI